MSYLFVSGWVRGKGRGGLGRYRFDETSGQLTFEDIINEDISFGTSVADKEKGILYVLCNKPQDVGLKVPSGGAVYEIHIDKATGQIKDIRVVPVYIANPCNLSLMKDGRFMVIAGHGTRNYVSHIEKGEDGEYHPVVVCDDVPVILLSMNEDGSIGKILDVVKHTGNGPLPKQQTAHPHCVTPSPLFDFFVVCDKGNDSVFSYSIDEAAGKLVRNGEPVFTDKAVCPRYCAFHPTLPFVYHNSENSTDIYVYRYDEKGILSLMEIVKGAQFSEDEKDRTTEGQGLNMHPSGRFLYNVTNGNNTIDVFSISDNGSATLIQSVAIDYAWPRGQIITPDGRFLILTCSVGGKILVFSINGDGTLTQNGPEIDFENAESMTLI